MTFGDDELKTMINLYDCPSCTVILDCPICKQKYDTPVVLPCGNVVCSCCISSLTKFLSKNSQFKCILCGELHHIPINGFPICKQFVNLLNPMNKICHNESSSSETLKIHLKEIKKKIHDLNNINTVDKVLEHCLNLRNEVRLSTKQAFQYLKELSDLMISQIDNYESECLKAMTVTRFNKQEYLKVMNELKLFHDEWDSYLKYEDMNQMNRLTDEQIELAVEMAIEMKKKSNGLETKIQEFIFNKKLISYEKNLKKIDKLALGTLNFQTIGPIYYSDLKQINIDNLLTDYIPYTIEIEALSDDNFYILYQLLSNKHLKCLTTNSDKTLITSFETNKPVIKFFKHKDLIIVNYLGGSGNHYNLQILNLKLQSLNQIDVHNVLGFNYNYRAHFLSVNDTKIYYFSLFSKNRSSNYQLRIFNKQLQYLKSIGQSNSPSDLFYFPFSIKQIECKNGKYYWLNENNLVITNESSGLIQKTIEIDADKFVIDSQNNIVLLNKSKRELNYFTSEGAPLKQIGMCDFLDDPVLFLNKNDNIVLFDVHKCVILLSV